MNSLGVAGRPILHSRSPALFRAAWASLPGGAAATPATYLRLSTDDADEALELAADLGLAGLNVTSPLKEAMASHMDRLGSAATALDAVNTVRCGPPREGHDTDPAGAVGALRSAGVELHGSRVVVVGTGGAGRAAAWGVAAAGAAEVVLISRDAGRAGRTGAQLAARRAADGESPAKRTAPPPATTFTGAALTEASGAVRRGDVVISCLPRGIELVDPGWLSSGQVVMDANYGGTALERAARSRGCRAVPGERWLLHQAAASFERLCGPSAPLEPMRRALQRGARAARPTGRTNVALVGFMGAGKSTVGRRLAALLDMDFVDTDERCEAEAGQPIAAQLAAPDGEARFRATERAVIERVATTRRTVFACGGGALLDERSRALVGRHALTIWLWAPLSVCLERIGDETRPLLDPDRGAGQAERLLRRRRPSYAEVADLVVGVARRPPAEAAELVSHEIRLVTTEGRPTERP